VKQRGEERIGERERERNIVRDGEREREREQRNHERALSCFAFFFAFPEID
jgi:hypothetical protein